MKKFSIVLGLILSITLFISCPGPVDNVVYSPLEEAVLEVYRLVGETFYYPGLSNRVSGPNEMPGVCGDYSIEFIYYWNEVKNYDEKFGRAYDVGTGSVNSPTSLTIADVEFVPKGTGGYSYINRDFNKTKVYEGYCFLHYGFYAFSHGWPVIKIGGDWYDTEPTNWDDCDLDFLPYKITF